MSRNRNQQAAAAAARFFMGLPTGGKVAVVAVALVVGAVALAIYARKVEPGAPPASAPVAPGTVAFMFWNVENLFDDRDDRRNSIDDPYDDWFAEDAAARKLKFDRLTEIILKQNGGNGPDILACVEVESLRAAELLRDALNAKVPAGQAKYEHVAMKELAGNAGRFMAPCVISKLPLDPGRTKLLGTYNLRVLETHVVANGAELTLIASHWTSQLSDKGTSKGSGRDKYAHVIREQYERHLTAKGDVDVLVCGDFNDNPESDAVANVLGVTGDRAAVTATSRPARLFGLLSGKPLDRYSTLYYDRERTHSIFDQVAVSPGMLDATGWGCDPDSVAVPTDGMSRAGKVARRPWRFGDRNDKAVERGYADHFPVTVNLKLAVAP
ncbi:MAG TPA: endonuclease/exonuclease/phosphatase family protein [Urbifossiella sp.]|nr:endonuclease/exonuclease/phosphatase family protein [Urbifossiella sp.]